MATNRYCIEVAKRGTAGCKNCKQKIDKDLVRIAKIVPNPFTDAGGEMKNWYHARCIFEALSRARATTKKIEALDDLEGWDELEDNYQDEILKYITEFSVSGKKTPQKQTPKKGQKRTASPSPSGSKSPQRTKSPVRSSSPSPKKIKVGKDDSFREFRRVCANIAEQPKYTDKTSTVAAFFDRGSSGDGFDGDIYLWVKLLLPGVDKRIYNIQSKQLVKLFSQIFGANQEEMLEDLDAGDVAETVRIFFEDSNSSPPLRKSSLTLQDIDGYLEEMVSLSKEGEQMNLLKKVVKKCTGNDLKMFVRLIKHDLKINTGAKHILAAIHPKAFEAFQASRDLKAIVKRFWKLGSTSPGKQLDVGVSLMTPVLPMLAQACNSVEMAFKKCPDGMFAEVKYDGERVQIHKEGSNFSYFSRSLKPVMSHKISHFKDYIPKAFPHGHNLIIDSEILLVDNKGTPLPFGSLGAHKKSEFKDANVCLFIFDCLHFNDKNLMKTPLVERRKILQDHMTVVKNHILLSEQKYVDKPEDLKKMIKSVIKQGLEGLVIKGKNSIYEPGKRHWLKVKKDYLQKIDFIDSDDVDKGVDTSGGSKMADSADLVVLGAFYGTGKNGGKMSIFLMGCLNGSTNKWCTVTKVHGGHDDETLENLQEQLNMKKIRKDASKVPSWLDVNKNMVPDFVAENPKKSQVWEIVGAEFTKTTRHTAAGISIRFPRVERIRDDKTWKEATTLEELKDLYNASKVTTELVGLSSPSRKGSRSRSSSAASRGSSQSPKRKTPKKESKSRSSSRSRSKSPSSAKKKSSENRGRSPTKKKLKQTATIKEKVDIKTDEKVPFDGVLPNIFTGVRICLPPNVKDYEMLKKYFIAFDGTLLKDFETDKATHIITDIPIGRENSSNDSAIQVTVEWLRDCIKLKRLLGPKLYTPMLV